MHAYRSKFRRIEEKLNKLPIFKTFGAVIEIQESGIASVSIENIQDIHTGGFQSTAINGMVLMGLLDSAICAAALSYFDGARCATVEISVKFLKPVIGENIKALGEVISRSSDIYFCKSSIVDPTGRIRALATGIVKSVQKENSNEQVQNIN